MRNIAILGLMTGLLGAGTPALADAPPPPVVNGTATSDFPAVVFMTTYNSSGYGGVCSGTLIAPRWVLTAAHCIEQADSNPSAWTVEIYFTSNIDAGYERRSWVSDWIIHPGYSGSSGTIAHDVALIELGVSVSDVEPMPLNEDSFNTGWIGDELTYVGFGITGTGRNDSGRKRYARIPISDYSAQIVYAIDPADQNICSGDSGGAALAPLPGGGYELVGVNSFGFATGGSGGDTCEGGGSGAMRVDAYTGWIDNYVDFDVVIGGDSDADADADADVDADADADADVDADADADADEDADIPGSNGPLPDDRNSFIDDYQPADLTPRACSAAPQSSHWMWSLIAVVLGIRARRD